jgi:hypothetical protein
MTAYASITDFKAYARITSTDTTDDGVIGDILESASKLIDTETRRTFYARVETRLYDVPDTDTLYIEDDDLLTVTTLTNGDSTVLTTTDYILLPANSYPKYAIKLKDSSTYSWAEDSSGNSEQAISILGTWGYSSSAPADIKEACLEIATAFYHRRFGENMATESTMTTGGVIVTPRDIPASARSIIANYARLA